MEFFTCALIGHGGDRGWDPVGLRVILDELFLYALHSNEPRWDSFVNEGRVGAPTERITMFIGLFDYKSPILF